MARAVVREGSGKIIINGINLDLYKPEIQRLKIRESLMIADELSRKVDIKVNVRGGGISSQAEAVRQSIAKGLVEFFNNDELKKKFLEHDRSLLVYDYRRTEPHKPSRSRQGARRHKQRSKR